MAKLSTHVLDTVNGRPAAGMSIELWRLENGERTLLIRSQTNADGRTDTPLLDGDAFVAGEYELLFFVRSYFSVNGGTSAGSSFLGTVPVRFSADPASGNYHVPLLCSPFSYTTYRGS